MSETKIKYGYSFPQIIFSLPTAIIAYTINGDSIFWAIVDYFLWPLAWLKWIICQEVTVSIIKKSFEWFLK